MTRTFIPSCRTPWRAESVSWETPARILGILFAAIDTPHTASTDHNPPVGASPQRRKADRFNRFREIRVIHRGYTVGAQVQHAVPQIGQIGLQALRQLIARVIGPDGDPHRSPPSLRWAQGGLCDSDADVQYRSGINRLPFKVAWSSYLCLLDRLGSFTLSRFNLL